MTTEPQASSYAPAVLIYAVQDTAGHWSTDPSAHIDGDAYEGTLTVTSGPHAGRRPVRYAHCEGIPANTRYQLDDYQRFYPTQWVRDQLDGWDDPKVAADPVGKLSAYANSVGGFDQEALAEIEAERSNQ